MLHLVLLIGVHEWLGHLNTYPEMVRQSSHSQAHAVNTRCFMTRHKQHLTMLTNSASMSNTLAAAIVSNCVTSDVRLLKYLGLESIELLIRALNTVQANTNLYFR